MITKPEDAAPHNVGNDWPLIFTAAECAQIARAYAYAERRHMSAMNDLSAIDYNAWQAKFAEWDK